MSLEIGRFSDNLASFEDFKIVCPVVHGAMGCSQKSFKLVWRCHQLLSGFLAKGHYPRVSRQSRRSLMIRVIMK